MRSSGIAKRDFHRDQRRQLAFCLDLYLICLVTDLFVNGRSKVGAFANFRRPPEDEIVANPGSASLSGAAAHARAIWAKALFAGMCTEAWCSTVLPLKPCRAVGSRRGKRGGVFCRRGRNCRLNRSRRGRTNPVTPVDLEGKAGSFAAVEAALPRSCWHRSRQIGFCEPVATKASNIRAVPTIRFPGSDGAAEGALSSGRPGWSGAR